MTKLLLLILLSLPPFYRDNEPEHERFARMVTVANAIERAASKATCQDGYDVPSCKPIWTGSKRSLAMLLVTKGFWESRFARHIHEGRCEKYECDPYKYKGQLIHRSRTVYQFQQNGIVTKEEWRVANGTDFHSTFTASWVSAKVLSMGYNKCKSVRGAISLYSGYRRCDWPGAYRRYEFWKKLMDKKIENLPELLPPTGGEEPANEEDGAVRQARAVPDAA